MIEDAGNTGVSKKSTTDKYVGVVEKDPLTGRVTVVPVIETPLTGLVTVTDAVGLKEVTATDGIVSTFDETVPLTGRVIEEPILTAGKLETTAVTLETGLVTVTFAVGVKADTATAGIAATVTLGKLETANELVTETLAVGLKDVTEIPGIVAISTDGKLVTEAVTGELIETLVTGLDTNTVAVGEKDVTATAGILFTATLVTGFNTVEETVPLTPIGEATVQPEMESSSVT